MMKKLTLAASALIIGLSAAHAADGTITINGQVTDKTCNVSSTAGKDFTVTLPTVSKISLATTGATSGRTPFQLQLSNCSGGKVATYFEQGTAVDTNTGRLNNQATATPATAVQVQLLGDNGQFLPITAATDATKAQLNSQWVDVAANGGTNLNYFAEYYATGAATAGEVTSSVQYSIIYQ